MSLEDHTEFLDHMESQLTALQQEEQEQEQDGIALKVTPPQGAGSSGIIRKTRKTRKTRKIRKTKKTRKTRNSMKIKKTRRNK